HLTRPRRRRSSAARSATAPPPTSAPLSIRRRIFSPNSARSSCSSFWKRPASWLTTSANRPNVEEWRSFATEVSSAFRRGPSPSGRHASAPVCVIGPLRTGSLRALEEARDDKAGSHRAGDESFRALPGERSGGFQQIADAAIADGAGELLDTFRGVANVVRNCRRLGAKIFRCPSHRLGEVFQKCGAALLLFGGGFFQFFADMGCEFAHLFRDGSGGGTDRFPRDLGNVARGVGDVVRRILQGLCRERSLLPRW